jgi:hypothetical protein
MSGWEQTRAADETCPCGAYLMLGKHESRSYARAEFRKDHAVCREAWAEKQKRDDVREQR